jgi:predicted GIY-YIG superfamily endonuclease
MTESEVEALALRRAVYRCYSGEGRLLYIGMTADAGGRLGSHSEKIWFLQVRGISLEWFPGHDEAAAAERLAIQVERPVYNRRRTALPEPTEDDRLALASIPPTLTPLQVLDDILAAVPVDEAEVWLEAIAHRLTAVAPLIYGGLDARALGTMLRRYDITPYQLWRDGQNRNAVRRTDILRTHDHLWGDVRLEPAKWSS